MSGQKGIITAKLGVEFAGNQPYTQKVKQEPVADSNKYSSPSNNAAVLRQAQIDLHILPYNSNEYFYSTVISVGGIRLGMAYGTAPDSANWPTGFGRQDGLHIQEIIQHNKQLKMSIGAGVFNTLAGSTPGKTYQGWYNNYAITTMSPWLNTAVNKDLAYVVDTNFNLNIDSENTLKITDYFGIQNNSPYLIDYATGQVAQVRDVNHTEASIIFNNSKILGNKGLVSGNGASLWYEREQNSRTKIVTMTPSNDYQYTNGLVNDAQIASLYGVGIAGDTSNYYSSIFYPTDRFTYAAAYTYVYSQFDDSNYALNYAVHQLAVSFGYAVESKRNIGGRLMKEFGYAI